MEWREQSTVSCDVAFAEAQRWVEEVTRKTFGGRHFRSALENGVLLCDLINRIKPGIIKRVNRLSTPIAGLDNINVFLKACGKLGLKEAQLFHPGDLQDLSSRVTVNQEETSRRLKNVLITIYWLGRKAQVDPFYNGPHLNLKAFEGLLGIALSKALEESSGPKRSVRDSGFGDGWYAEREEPYALQSAHRREASLDSLDSVESRTLSISSEATLKGSSEGCSSDAEADHRSGTMADGKDLLQFRRSQAIEPRTATQFNQFLPSKDKPAAYVPAPLRKKRADRHEDNRRSWASPMYTEEDGTFTSGDGTGADSRPQNGYDAQPSAHRCSYEYESESDSDLERPEPDLVLDDLASRRFRSPPPVTPANYAVPSGLPSMAAVPKAPRNSVAFLSSTSPPPPPSERRTAPMRAVPGQPCYDSEDEDDEDEVGYADPVQDDLYARKIGMPPLSSANVPYDRFLPKYWTPEEEAHVQRIKLGSQRRPWYRKMQGFSQKKSGSSSDDSDTDIAPWLVPAPPVRQQLDMATSNQYTPGGPILPDLTTRSPHMQQYTVVPPHTTQPQLGFSRPDPTAGPRVVRCAKGSVLGSRYLSEPHVAAQDLLPDLENDDMFARRTRSFHSGIDLAGWKPESRTRVAARSWLEASIVTQPRRGERVTPDIERDDLVFRKFNQPKTDRPPSGAPDVYRALPVPEPWSLPAKLQTRLLCTPCPLEHGEKTRDRDGRRREHVASDDMLLRRLGAGQPQGAGHPSLAAQPIPGVPSSCSDADMNKWQAIREASRLRYKKKLMVERLLQKRSGRDGSKSVEDIPESPVLRQVRYEDLQRIRAQVKECEDKWQDDLTRWKNRRRSINSDIVKKKEERDQMELIASGSSTRRSRTFGEVQEERDSREQDTLGSNGNMLSSSSVQDPASEIRPLAKIQLGQNYTINTTPTQGPDAPAPQSGPTQQLFSSALPSDSPASLSDGPASLTDGPALSSISPAPLMSAPPPSAQNSTDRGADTKRPSSSTEISASFSNQILAAQPAERSPSPPYAHRSMEAKPGTARVSVSLPRSYQRSDGSRLTSVVTPRPFGTQATRISSLPRSFIMDDSHKRFNGEAGTAHRASVPSRYSQFLTSEDETRSQSSSVQSSNEDEEEEEHQEELGPPPPSSSSNPGTSEVVPQPTMVSQLSTTTDGDGPQEYYSDMRISLNQKPNSSRDFGFQTSWDSTGARVKSVQPGSPAELCRLQVGDVVLAVGGRRVSDMSYDEWKGSLEAALQHGSLVMDVRRHGKNGGPEKHVISSLERNSGTLSAETPTKTEERRIQPVNDLPAKGVNGGFRDESVTVRHKEHESISLRNLKRRSEFFEQKGGSDSAISDLQVPSLSTTSNRWSWDPEEERRRQEKWQKEQERLLQEKYKRDQEKLEEEWKRAQQEVAKEDSGSKEDQKILQLESRSSITFSSHQVPLSESTPPSLEEDQWEAAREWEEEERCRREQEEWRQKEQEERRQEEEDRRRFQSIEEEQESHRLQEQQQWEKSKSTPELDDVDKPAKRGRHGVRGGGAKSVLEQERRGNRDFRAQRSLAIASLEAKRKNILSTLSYRGPERVSGGEGTWSRDSQRKRSTPLSQAELERQQILQEMKKKTQLLTDSSWIRQRSTSVINKEPVNLGGHIRRGESLDNLDSARPWRPLSWSSVSASSAPSYSRPHSSLSTLSSASSLGYARSGAATLPSSYSTGSLRQSPWSQPPSASPTPPGAPAEEPAPESRPPSQQRTSASAASPTSGVLNPEPRSESETDSSTATPVTSESKAVSPPPCDLTLQQIEEEAN